MVIEDLGFQGIEDTKDKPGRAMLIPGLSHTHCKQGLKLFTNIVCRIVGKKSIKISGESYYKIIFHKIIDQH